MRAALVLSALFALGCAGLGSEPAPPPPAPPVPEPAPAPNPAPDPEPPADEAWVDEAVAEALEWEVMPGTSGGEEDPARPAALRAFFLAHPEYRDPEQRARLAREACGLDGTEAAHAYLVNPPPKTPVIVEVSGADWKVMVSHADAHCTSDDWSWYTSEASQAAAARGAVTAYGGAENDVVVVVSAGTELARIPLSGQGWLMARAGREPAEAPYDPSSYGPAFEAYFGPANERGD